jgi:hypothetical protein
MARGRTREQRANSLNSLAAPANNATDVSSSELQLKDRGSAAWNFRQDHVVRKFDQLANDELEELSHAPERLITNAPSHNSHGATGTRTNMNFACPRFQRFGASVFLSRPASLVATRGSEPQLNKCTDANWRPQSEAPEGMTVPGPIAARFVLFSLPVPRLLPVSYSS